MEEKDPVAGPMALILHRAMVIVGMTLRNCECLRDGREKGTSSKNDNKSAKYKPLETGNKHRKSACGSS